MLADSLQIALKEWAVVQRALLEGHQLIMLRKGGIIEETGDFDLRAEQFLIQPTYAHETERAGDLQPCFGQWLAEEEARRPREAVIRFEAACEVVDTVRLISPDTLLKLAPQHIWSSQFIEGRFNWEPYKPMTALIVRAYRSGRACYRSSVSPSTAGAVPGASCASRFPPPEQSQRSPQTATSTGAWR